MTKEELCRLEQSELVKLIDEGQLAYLPAKIGDDIYWVCDEDEDDNSATPYVRKQKNGIAGFAIKKDGIRVIDTDDNIDEIGGRYCCLSVAQAESFILSEAKKALKESKS